MSNISSRGEEPPLPWLTTEATVTSCRYQFAGLSNLAFGVSTQKKFRIGFDYYAHGRLYSDVFQSGTAIPQNTRIPITYNPLKPQENSRTSGPHATPARSPVVSLAVLGSVLLAILSLAALHSCN
jgi:hypothetical protein